MTAEGGGRDVYIFPCLSQARTDGGIFFAYQTKKVGYRGKLLYLAFFVCYSKNIPPSVRLDAKHREKYTSRPPPSAVTDRVRLPCGFAPTKDRASRPLAVRRSLHAARRQRKITMRFTGRNAL